MVRLTFSFGRLVFLLCLAPCGLGLPPSLSLPLLFLVALALCFGCFSRPPAAWLFVRLRLVCVTIGLAIASHLKPLCGNRRGRRSPQRRLPQRGYRGQKSAATTASRAKWASDWPCYFCHCNGHTVRDHRVPFPFTDNLDVRWHESQKWVGIVIRLAQDHQSGDTRGYTEVATEVGVNRSNYTNLTQKRELALVVHLKVGGEAWVDEETIDPRVAPDKCSTPGASSTAMSEDDEDGTQSNRQPRCARDARKSTSSRRSPESEDKNSAGFTTGWKTSVDSQLKSLHRSVKKLSNTIGQNLQLMKLMLRPQNVPQEAIDEVMQVHNLDEDLGPS